MQPRECDVLVVGGGPAGSTAGHLLARAGRDVVVVERERFPRFHVGESLLPANMPLLDRLGVRRALLEAGSIPKYGAQVLSAEGAPAVRIRFTDGLLPSPESALQVVRSTFDSILLDASAAAGAEVLHEHEAVSADLVERSWRVQVRPRDGVAGEVRARYLVDASGRDTFLARMQRTKTMDAKHRRVAVFAHFRGVPRPLGSESGDVVLAIRRDGWLWVIPLADERTSIGLVVQGDALRRAGCSPEAALEHALAHTPALAARLRNAERVTEVDSTSNYSYRGGPSVRDGALVIGDARAFLDPVFSTGVWLAMHGGQTAAEALDACLSDPRHARSVFSRWSKRQDRLHRYYWRLIDSFYTPEFIDLLLQPSTAPILRGLVPALNSTFAGLGPGPLSLRARLRLFEAIQLLHRHFDIRPKLQLGSVFDG